MEITYERVVRTINKQKRNLADKLGVMEVIRVKNGSGKIVRQFPIWLN